MPAYRYTSPIEVSADTTVRFVSVAPDGTITEVQQAAYEFYADAVASAPSFSATATLAPPTVTAQRSATANVPSFTAQTTLTPPTVSGSVVNPAYASATVPSFSARATFTTPPVTAQQQARASVPSFAVTATIAPPVVSVLPAAAVSCTADVPQFSATAVLIPPTVTANTVSSGSIRGPDGAVLDIRDIYGNPFVLRDAA